MRALSIASAARRATSSRTAISSGSCRCRWWRPTARVPSRCPRATSGTAKPSSGGAERHLRAGPRGLPQPGEHRVGPALLQHGVQPRQHRLVGVAGGGEAEPAPLVGRVHRAPLPEPGHDELGDQRHRQVDVERLGEQLARLGEERQPALPAQVGPAQPVVLQVQREPFGDQLARAAGRTPRARRPAPAHPTYGRLHGQRHPELVVAVGAGGAAVPGQHAAGRRRRRGRAAPRRRPRRPARRPGTAGRRRSRAGRRRRTGRARSG